MTAAILARLAVGDALLIVGAIRRARPPHKAYFFDLLPVPGGAL
ncbi:hypothetical protein UCD39_16945 [Nitrospirillum sp. BR 11752]|nr:hypothetical protein [Nitrospirillum amazonense]MEE3625651.1 hypothetical protein [Nitrospirillum sp. BR 11752]